MHEKYKIALLFGIAIVLLIGSAFSIDKYYAIHNDTFTEIATYEKQEVYDHTQLW